MKFFHRHTWEAVGVTPFKYVNSSWSAAPGTKYPGTTVLYRCPECNKTTTRDLEGAWTLEQVRGETCSTS